MQLTWIRFQKTDDYIVFLRLTEMRWHDSGKFEKKHKFVELRIMHFHILSGGRRSFFRFLKCDIFEDSGILLLAQILNIFSLTKWLEI